MEDLKVKLEKEAEKVSFDKRVGFPLKAIMKHVMEKADSDEGYKCRMISTDFGETLVYIAEYMIKEVVESEERFVPDEVVYSALDKWILEDEKRNMLLEVVANVKHPQMRSRNPFFEMGFLSKANLENMDEDFKKLPAVTMLIKKYYVETKSSSTRSTKTIVKKKETEQPSLLDLMTGDVPADSEKDALKDVNEQENINASNDEVVEEKQQNVVSFKTPASKKKIDGQMDLFSML